MDEAGLAAGLQELASSPVRPRDSAKFTAVLKSFLKG